MKLRYKIFLLLALLIVGAVFVSSQFGPVKAATRKIVYSFRANNGLIGYWSLNGADTIGVLTNDGSGNSNNGTLTGGAMTAEGAIGQGAKFDGVDDYVNIPYSSVFDFGTGNFSFSAWARKDGSGVGGEHIVGRYGAGSQPRWGLKTGGGSFQVFIVDSDGVSNDFGGNFTPTTGQWYHLVGVVNRTTNTSTLYVDGVQTDTKDISSFTGNFSSGSGAVQVGAVSGNYFKGAIDEVRLYNRALTAEEIAYQYNKTNPTGAVGKSGTLVGFSIDETGVAGDWNFDESDSSETVADGSGNGNTGTMYKEAGPTAGNLRATGKVGNGISLDGTNDYITGSGSGLPNDGANGNITLSAWINPTSLAGIRTIFNKGSIGDCFNYGMVIEGGVLKARNTSTDYSLGGSVVAGKWQHVAIVFNGASGATGYIDGVPVGTNASAVTSNCADTNWVIGTRAYNGAASEWFDGLIDEVKVRRQAVPAQKIKKLYLGGVFKVVAGKPQDPFVPQQPQVANNLQFNLVFNGQNMAGVNVFNLGGLGGSATLTGGARTAPGVVGQAVELDGVNDYVTMSDIDGLSFTDGGGNDQPFSVSYWIKRTGTSWVGLEKAATDNYEWVFSSSGNLPVFKLYMTSGSAYIGRTSSTQVPLNEWVHLVGTYSGSETSAGIKIYQDGVQVDSANSESGSYTGQANLAQSLDIGKSTIGSLYGQQEIDEIRIYGLELSATEVATLYRGERIGPRSTTFTAPTITTTSLPDGTNGSAYSETLAMTGGCGNNSWSVTSGALPDGLSLASGTGIISGTPTVTDTFNFTVTVTDGCGYSDAQALTIIINAGGSPLTITTTSPLTSVSVSGGHCVPVPVFTATGGTAPYTWSIPQRDALAQTNSVAVNANTGQESCNIVGAPGTATFQIRVTDAVLDTDTDTVQQQMLPF